METIWFESWDSRLRIIFVTTIAYTTVVLLLRVSGKRTLAKMNAFDFVVTIALGTILTSVVLNSEIPFADGITAFLVFIEFQYLFTWLSVRLKPVKILITSKPSLIFYKGEFNYKALKKVRITVEEVHSSTRINGFSTLNEIDIIILETTGEITIIEKITEHTDTTFDDVELTP